MDRSLGFDSEGWKRFAAGVEIAQSVCLERGYEPTFHHETGTHIEAVWEIEKVLELTSIGLCLDTGHLLLGETSVVVVASTPHRGEAFDAARFAIDTLKATVPIWKKETWAGGSDWATGAAPLGDVKAKAGG